MKTLCLFTNEFPYGTWEPYLETEVQYYSAFDKVFIFALQLRKEHAAVIRPVPENVTVIPVHRAPNWKYLLYAFRTLADANLYAEIGRLKRDKRLHAAQLVQLFVYLSRSYYEAGQILKAVPKADLEGALFYSYRFEYQPYVACLLRRFLNTDNKIVSRAHGYDLYESARKSGYIPLRTYLLNEAEYCFPCSRHGARYLADQYPEFEDKIQPRFLGTIDCGIQPYRPDQAIRVVSCSNVVPVKRLDLIVQALHHISDRQVVWTHFGDGPLLDEIKALAGRLPENVTAVFRGNVENRVLMTVYRQESFDLFINVSQSEGIPVSIMEAMSFGIPCIATDVGGTSEIVQDGVNGRLLKPDCLPEDIANQILEMTGLEKEEYMHFRSGARRSWSSKYDSDANYREFVRELEKFC